MCSTGGRLRDHATALFGGKIRIVVATVCLKGICRPEDMHEVVQSVCPKLQHAVVIRKGSMAQI